MKSGAWKKKKLGKFKKIEKKRKKFKIYKKISEFKVEYKVIVGSGALI